MKIADAEKVEKAREEMSSAVGVSIGISSYCRNAIMLHPQFVDLKHGLRNLIELLRSPPDETAPSGDDITGELADRLDLLLGGATS